MIDGAKYGPLLIKKPLQLTMIRMIIFIKPIFQFLHSKLTLMYSFTVPRL